MKIENLITVKLTSADISDALQNCIKYNVTLYNIRYVDKFCIHFQIRGIQKSALEILAQKKGYKVEFLKKVGAQYLFFAFLQRPVMLFFIVLLLLFSTFLSTRVLFVEVKGAKSISVDYLLEKAQVCGIKSGVSRRSVRSENVKNRLIALVPELHWVGVNTYGCVAIITVEEKNLDERNSELQGQVSSIIASCDGVITECTVQKGTQVCKEGQAVKTGQLLVSGYIDCGLKVEATNADAEIYAKTLRYLTAIFPRTYQGRMNQNGVKINYTLQIGKKLIKLFKDSGIYHTTCAKIYSRKDLYLPGGRKTQISLLQEKNIYYTNAPYQIDVPVVKEQVCQIASQYLEKQMVAGRIVQIDADVSCDEDVCRLEASYNCVEMIGKVRVEECLYNHG